MKKLVHELVEPFLLAARALRDAMFAQSAGGSAGPGLPDVIVDDIERECSSVASWARVSRQCPRFVPEESPQDEMAPPAAENAPGGPTGPRVDRSVGRKPFSWDRLAATMEAMLTALVGEGGKPEESGKPPLTLSDFRKGDVVRYIGPNEPELYASLGERGTVRALDHEDGVGVEWDEPFGGTSWVKPAWLERVAAVIQPGDRVRFVGAGSVDGAALHGDGTVRVVDEDAGRVGVEWDEPFVTENEPGGVGHELGGALPAGSTSGWWVEPSQIALLPRAKADAKADNAAARAAGKRIEGTGVEIGPLPGNLAHLNPVEPDPDDSLYDDDPTMTRRVIAPDGSVEYIYASGDRCGRINAVGEPNECRFCEWDDAVPASSPWCKLFDEGLGGDSRDAASRRSELCIAAEIKDEPTPEPAEPTDGIEG